MRIIPVTLKQAKDFIESHHRHSCVPQGWKFGCGLEHDGALVGVAVLGRPVARGLDDGTTCEVTRLCTDGTRLACSRLYGAVLRAAKSIGYTKAVTYTREDEPGISPVAAGFCKDGVVTGRSWNCKNRPRDDRDERVSRTRWVRHLTK